MFGVFLCAGLLGCGFNTGSELPLTSTKLLDKPDVKYAVYEAYQRDYIAPGITLCWEISHGHKNSIFSALELEATSGI